MTLDTATHARLSLLGLFAALLLCMTVAYGVRTENANGLSAESRQSPYSRPARESIPGDVYITQQLAGLQQRVPTAAEYRRVFTALEDQRWAVTRGALRVLQVHRHPQWRNAQLQVLRRAGAATAQNSSSLPSVREWRECLSVLREIVHQDLSLLADARGGCDDLAPVLADLALSCEDGSVRARALTLMALAPHGDWHQIVLAALDDPSERVCVAALEIVAANRWDAAAPRVEQLASSPRPELRRCALAALQDLGRVVKPREYGDCVMRAASRLADQLAEIGVDFELSEIVGGQRSGALDFEELNRAAEAYLDRAPDSASSVRDFQGILFLAAAARVQQRKLTLRLWEHEIARADSDAELLDHGLQTVARAQLLAGLAALRRGDQTAGLQAIASVARLARSATPHSPLQVYVKQASHLSSAIWQATTTNASEPGSTVAPRASDSVTQVVVRVLGKLDLSRLEHNEEARRRLDEWCELDTHTPTRSHNAYQPVAN